MSNTNRPGDRDQDQEQKHNDPSRPNQPNQLR